MTARVLFVLGFQMMVEAGIEPKRAAAELPAHFDRLLYRNGELVDPGFARQLWIELRTEGSAIVPVLTGGVTVKGPLILKRDVLELDQAKLKALIAKLAKPKRDPGRHDHAMKDDIHAEYDRRRAVGEPHEAADLERWAVNELKKLPKYTDTTVPHVDTIRHWIREGWE
jgi:hypothetical protein